MSRRLGELDRLLEERCREDLERVLLLPEGRRCLWYLMDRSHVFRSSFTGNSETFFREGERNVGLFILAGILDVSPECFGQIQKEYSEWLLEMTSTKKEEEVGYE